NNKKFCFFRKAVIMSLVDFNKKDMIIDTRFDFNNCVSEEVFEKEMFDYIDGLSNDLKKQLSNNKKTFNF
ncbi:MAG: threonine aldolase family protein, partial [Candidatus Peribacteria bacterium]|nr:threonine aldolase family protein [Candidatus Peribacteria bacterium]